MKTASLGLLEVMVVRVNAAKYTLNLEASVRHASVGVKQVYIYK